MREHLVIIMKNPGKTCNLNCTYCAEARKSIDTVTEKISLELVDKLLEDTKDYDLTLTFHGGEPTLLEIEYYKKIIERCKQEDRVIIFGLQTNGTRINNDWIEFLKENQDCMGISISLDGDEDINAYRVDRNMQASYQRVCDSIRMLEKEGIKVGLISTITQKTLHKEKELVDLYSQFSNIRFVKLNPCFDINPDGSLPFWGITPREYSDFVNNFCDEWLKTKIFGEIIIEPIVSIWKNMVGVETSFCAYSSDEKCSHFISLYPDGTMTTCDNYTIEEGYLGNLNNIKDINEVVGLKTNYRIKDTIQEQFAQCNTCRGMDICKGGCMVARLRYSKYYKKDKDMYCNSILSMVDHLTELYRKHM